MNIDRYLGLPWVADRYNCFELVRDFYRNELAIEIPESGVSAVDPLVVANAFIRHPLRKSFHVIEKPVHCCVVGMRLVHGSYRGESHCGIYLQFDEGGFVLHNWRGAGVLLERDSRLEWRGLVISGFYEYL